MTTRSHFKPSSIGDIHRSSMVEARVNTMLGVGHRTGTTDGIGTRQTIDHYNSWYREAEGRPSYRAPAIEKAQSNIGPDAKPIDGSMKFGVQASSIPLPPGLSARGDPATPMNARDSVELPDSRDSFGHNTHARFSRVRG